MNDTAPQAGLRHAEVAAREALMQGRHGDPFAVLGPHDADGRRMIRTLRPGVEQAWLIDPADGRVLADMQRTDDAGFFEGELPAAATGYRLRYRIADRQWDEDDPYRFGSAFGAVDLYLLGEGSDTRYVNKLGAHPVEHEGVHGTRFAVWAPNAHRVSVIGSFNEWDGRRHPMRRHPGAGVWELFVPGVHTGALYKYEILGNNGIGIKADPVAFQAERPPLTASVVHGLVHYDWTDAGWMSRRATTSLYDSPMSVYEVHLESWRRHPDGRSYSYDELADTLIPYVRELGFTHIECLPLSEYPFGGSWGYQPTSMFAPTSRFGPPEAFARFVDRCHAAGVGVIVDFVPAHFPSDPHGLARFDGTALYEHEDPRQGFHRDWNTLIYNFGRVEVRNFLVAAARYWIEYLHIDALRVDAVASMLYLDYSRPADQWVPNRFGGNHNLEAIEFLRRMNIECYAASPGIATIAEESTAFSGVSRPVDAGGLGFGFKWNMGWMHDTLSYIGKDPIYRSHHQDQITFGLHYAFTESYVLPLSHDEVVHGKGSLLARMPGDAWQQFANLRAYFGLMWTHPGKKLLFMGGELAQHAEWNHDAQLDWPTLGNPRHAGVQRLIRDLNALYRAEPALHQRDHVGEGFRWIDTLDRDGSTFVFSRHGHEGNRPVVIVANFTPAVRHHHRIGLPHGGRWAELLNTDAQIYDGSGVGNGGSVHAEDAPHHGLPHSATITIPPLAVLVLAPA